MPKFMDFHDDLKLPPEVITKLKEAAKDGSLDQFQVRTLELYHNADGKVYCFLEAPDAEAVRKRHQHLGVPCGEVHKIDTLL